MTALTAVCRPRRPVDARTTLAPLRHGRGDPTFRTTRDGAIWRTSRTPHGPATLRIASCRGEISASAWGPGGDWLLDGLPDLVGARDDPSDFQPVHPVVAEAHRHHPGLRMPRTRLVFESLVPAILEQKVTAAESCRSWRELVGRFGETPPGPAPAGMRVAPPPRVWARIPSWEWHRAGVDSKRSATIVRSAHVASRLEEAVHMSARDALRRLRAVPGVGVWTAAEVAQRAFGDADAVSVGDFHVSRLVGWALLRRPLDDDGMLEVLAPYAPHRHRVVRLIELSGIGKPRFAPRFAPRDYRHI